jgi:hypothetical protein
MGFVSRCCAGLQILRPEIPFHLFISQDNLSFASDFRIANPEEQSMEELCIHLKPYFCAAKKMLA